MKEKGIGFWNIFFTAICCLLLTILSAGFILLLFMYALNENIVLPAVGFISGDWLALIFDSWYLLAFGIALLVTMVLMVVLINISKIRRIYIAIGCTSIMSAILNIAIVMFRTHILKLFPAEWQEILVNTTAVFKDFEIICVIILVMIGATCLSIYSGIVVVKGDKGEKNT